MFSTRLLRRAVLCVSLCTWVTCAQSPSSVDDSQEQPSWLQAIWDLPIVRFFIAFDLADLEAVQNATERLNAEGPGIDILVNNGAIGGWGPLHQSTLAHWENMFDVNVSSMYLLCRDLSKGMVARKWGRIINFASYVSDTGRPNLSAYVASKHAVLGLTRSIAADLAPHGVTCNAIAPGFFDTDMAAPTVGNPARAKIFRSAIALDRFGDPKEMVGPVQFLASDASGYITGHMLPVDGGVANILSLPVVVET